MPQPGARAAPGGAGGTRGGTFGSTGKAGTAGAGGNAQLVSFNGSSGTYLTMNATLTGGDGGNGSNGGNGGTASTLNPIYASLTSPNTIVTNLYLLNGNGGNGANGNGGSGSTVSIYNAASLVGSGASVLNFTALGLGGSGGSTVNGTAGSAGSAYVTMITAPNNPSGTTTYTAIAYGGNGGSAQSGGSTAGANAGAPQADAEITSGSQIANANAYANYGGLSGMSVPSGGNVTGGTGNGGTGNYSQATAVATSNNKAYAGYIDADSTAVSIGLNGGSVSNGALGNGGAGGTSFASSTATGNNSRANLTSTGGNGGQGEGAGYSGGNGGVPFFTTFGITSSGSYLAGSPAAIGMLTLVGGNGGAGVSGAAAGNGAAASDNTNILLSIHAAANLQVALTESLTGGNAGSSDGGPIGIAGDASVVIPFSGQTVSNKTSWILSAIGGGGSNAQNTSGGNSGTATASLSGTISGSLSGTVIATGAQAGSVAAGSGAYNGGNGGVSTATCNLTSLTSAYTYANAQATGGNGGDITAGLNGNGGTGGAAIATAVNSNSFPDAIEPAYSVATGGNGGQGSSTGYLSGTGGSANASSNTTNSTGPALADARAYGGATGATVGGAIGGSLGTALANADAYSNAYSSSANAVATGSASVANATAICDATYIYPPSAFAIATANASSGSAVSASQFIFSGGGYVQTYATAPVDHFTGSYSASLTGSGNATFSAAIAAFNAAAGTNAFTLISSITQGIDSADVTSAWNTSSNVSHAFGANSNVNSLGISLLQVQSNASGSNHAYSTVTDLNLPSGSTSSGQLLIGATNIDALGVGLNNGGSMRFRIERQGVAVIDQTFTTNAAFTNYLSNTVFDLGTENANLGSGNLDVQVLFNFTAGSPGNGLGSLFLIGANPSLFQLTWSGATSGSWMQPLNWQSSTLPNGPGASALFSSVGAFTPNVTLDAPATLGNLLFNASSNYTLASGTGGTLTLDNGGTAATVAVAAGSQTISAPVSVASGGVSVDIISGNTLTLSGSVNGSGGIMTVDTGTLNLTGSAALGGLTINAGKVSFAPSVKTAMSTASLTFNGSSGHWTGQLDLNRNDLIVHNGNLSNLTDQIHQGYNAGSWNGSGGILSSTAAANSTHLTALGVISNNISGTAIYTSFDTHPVVVTDVLVKYTYYGDANLDGIVDGSDYPRIDNGYLSHGTLTGWFNGDFNYDGAVNGSDYTLIDNAFNTQGAPLTSQIATPTDQLSGAASGVPEPSTLGSLCVSALGVLGRRRKRL